MYTKLTWPEIDALDHCSGPRPSLFVSHLSAQGEDRAPRAEQEERQVVELQLQGQLDDDDLLFLHLFRADPGGGAGLRSLAGRHADARRRPRVVAEDQRCMSVRTGPTFQYNNAKFMV